MGNRGRLIAPGDLRDVLAGEADDGPATGESLAGLAAQYGLRPSSARPGLASYLARVWQRRHFIVAYATARNVSMYTEARLGQLWQVLTPLLNSAVYYLIFGILFKANRGITNYTAYLVTGVFIFAFTERSIVVGSTVMRPQGPGHFFPYWTQARVGGLCVWEFGNMRNGNTFGGDAQYGSVGPGTVGAFAGPIRRNPNC